jgi:hypothetical protein
MAGGPLATETAPASWLGKVPLGVDVTGVFPIPPEPHRGRAGRWCRPRRPDGAGPAARVAAARAPAPAA